MIHLFGEGKLFLCQFLYATYQVQINEEHHTHSTIEWGENKQQPRLTNFFVFSNNLLKNSESKHKGKTGRAELKIIYLS